MKQFEGETDINRRLICNFRGTGHTLCGLLRRMNASGNTMHRLDGE